jgi:hypothetical protein
MKSKLRSLLLSICMTSFLAAHPAHGQGVRQFTTTLIPVATKATRAEGDSALWIKTLPAQDIFLKFDLGALPPGATIQKATLRLVAGTLLYKPDDPNSGGQTILIKVQLARDDFSGVTKDASIALLATLTTTNKIAWRSIDSLTVAERYASPNKTISLRLSTISNLASTLLYSTSTFGNSQSNIPRLVIEYTMGPPGLLESLSWSQHQANPEHTGRNTWTPFQKPSGYRLEKINMPAIPSASGNKVGGIADYPLIYDGDLYLIYKVEDLNYLLALDFKGNELWRRAIGNGTVQRPPAISTRGVLYVATEKGIGAYDVTRGGEAMSAYALQGRLSDFTDMTIGNDGSVFVAVRNNDLNYIYGFTPALLPFLKAGPFRSGEHKISTVTVSPDGRRLFAQTADSAVVIDIVEPSTVRRVALTNPGSTPWEYYHTPVAGPDGGTVIFSDFTSTDNKGNVWGSGVTPKDSRTIWSATGTLVPQPVLGSNGLVYYIQDGALRGHTYNRIGQASISVGSNLNTTSNLVMDGANNIYFWDNGVLLGYDSVGVRLFELAGVNDMDKKRKQDPETLSDTIKAKRSSSGPEQFIRLLLAPDGTLWANNRRASELFAFIPTYATIDPVLTAKLNTHTVYRAGGVVTVGPGVAVQKGTQILLQGQNGVAFPPGFAVDSGATLLVRTGN